MSKIEFKTYTPAQIADNLKTLSNEQLIEVLKCLAQGRKKVTEPPTLVPDDPFKNKEGELCGLCDGRHAHEHPRVKCSLCGEEGLVENMAKHSCTRLRPCTLDDETPLAERFVREYSELTQRLEQLKINQDWLIQRTDGIHGALCPGRIATWQERAIQAETVAHKLVKACEPFIHFITQFERQPLVKLHDEFYGIHNGTEFEANLRLSEFKKIRDLLRPNQRTGPTVVNINGSKVTLTPDDCMALTYQRIVDLADTQWGKTALHSVTFHDRVTGHGGILSPGRSVVPTEGMSITAVVTGSA